VVVIAKAGGVAEGIGDGGAVARGVITVGGGLAGRVGTSDDICYDSLYASSMIS
jgi:hypothetical protein